MKKITNSEILALIDDLNQYLNGNVTKLGLLESIKELQNKLNTKKQTYYNNYFGEYTI